MSIKNWKIDYTEFLVSTLTKKTYLRKERLFEAFCMFDKNGNGKITRDEIMQVLKLEKGQENEVEEMMELADKNKDGTIDYKKFLESN